jgi:cytochrome P450
MCHRDAQQNLADEIEAVCPDGKITTDRIERLHLHTRVIQEALRLYPPVASIGLSPMMAMEVAGVALRPGDHITIAIYLLHRHKRLWGT